MENALFGGIPSDFVTTDSETCAFRESIICGGISQYVNQWVCRAWTTKTDGSSKDAME